MKKVAPNVPIYMGGPRPRITAKEFLQNHEVEGIMRGEGEKYCTCYGCVRGECS